MTGRRDDTLSAGAGPRPSLLPFDPDQLTAIRVRPVEFATMCSVSRQAVSKWIKKGLFTVGPDGRFDPAHAWRQVFKHSDPAKLRARVFKDAMTPVATLRERVHTLEAELAAVERATKNRCMDRAARITCTFCALVERNFEHLIEAHRAGHLLDALNRLEWQAHGYDPAEYPDDLDDDDPGDDADSRETSQHDQSEGGLP